MPTPSPFGPKADSLFAAWLARQEAGKESDFEALCREHPAEASELRQLFDCWDRLEVARRQHGLGGSLSEKLKSQYPSGVDPQATLEGEDQVKGDFSSEVLSRLAGRGPAFTRYRVKGEVAHGGMGTVLRVWDEDLRRHLAMKVMQGKGVPREQGEEPQAAHKMLARFLEEAQVTGQLDHPGIVPVHELGIDAEGRVYFTMKLVKGKTLKDVFDEVHRGEGGWSQTRVLGLIQKVCEAMSFAHDKGVIHRDLKPANIMVGRYGEVFVMDWGLAKILSRKDEKDIRIQQEPALTISAVRSDRYDRAGSTPDLQLYTMDGDVVGTPAYMSPEQAKGDLAAMGPHSDVYGVGALLYHLLAGSMPYVPPGARLNNYAVWHRVQEGPPKPLHELAPEQPAELIAICERAMARDRQARYENMAALSEDLSAYLEGRVVQAYETGALAEARKWILRNKPLASSMAAAVALLVLGLVSSLLLKAKSDANAQDARLNADRAVAEAEEADRNAQEARANLALAQRNEAEARAQQQRAEAETAKVLRLSDAKVLQELEREADALWPAHPDKIAEMESWLERAQGLAARLEVHRGTLAEMRSRAQPWSMEEHVRGAGLEPDTAALTEQIESSRQTWNFSSPEDQWQHDVLAELVENLELLLSGLLAADSTTLDYGWSVPKRLAFARKLESAFGEGGEYTQAWSAVLPAIRATYPGLDLEPQMGLLPIGPDPVSGLWEFADLTTGVPAKRAPGGKLMLTGDTGLVLVLLPGGTFWMGAQSSDPDGRNYDPLADIDEGPVHEVELSAFFLSKHEMTQGQWLRLTGRNPSFLRPDNQNVAALFEGLSSSLLYPVEQVSWDDCMALLPRAELRLPSEAQWEYGARGGTDTPWWTGEEKETLAGAANLADSFAREHGGWGWVGIEEWLDDGAATQAPVGSYRANPFGLHEVTGNLLEWCLDGYDAGYYARAPWLDPLSPWERAPTRVYRGGSFCFSAIIARSAARNDNAPFNAINMLGVRPARGIVP